MVRKGLGGGGRTGERGRLGIFVMQRDLQTTSWPNLAVTVEDLAPNLGNLRRLRQPNEKGIVSGIGNMVVLEHVMTLANSPKHFDWNWILKSEVVQFP
jgi:hypothetical protein